MNQSLALLIVLLMALASCFWYAVANRSHSKKLVRYHNSRVPAGEVAEPSYHEHHHIGSGALLWILILSMGGILIYMGVPIAAYKAIVNHKGYFEQSMPDMPEMPTFGKRNPQKTERHTSGKPPRATHSSNYRYSQSAAPVVHSRDAMTEFVEQHTDVPSTAHKGDRSW